MPVHMTPTIWCFPFAGASYYSYRPIFKELEASYPVMYLELPGRGNRLHEPLLHTYEEVLQDIMDQMAGKVNEPFILFGHSMGAQLAIDAAHGLVSSHQLKPSRLIVSGRGAPSVITMKRRYDMPKAEFVQALTELGGIPREILDDAEFFSFFEPILRADFKAIENFAYAEKPPLDIPVIALIGDAEETSVEEAEAWRHTTTGPFALHVFEGGHFFILEHTDRIVKLVTEQE